MRVWRERGCVGLCESDKRSPDASDIGGKDTSLHLFSRNDGMCVTQCENLGGGRHVEVECAAS